MWWTSRVYIVLPQQRNSVVVESWLRVGQFWRYHSFEDFDYYSMHFDTWVTASVGKQAFSSNARLLRRYVGEYLQKMWRDSKYPLKFCEPNICIDYKVLKKAGLETYGIMGYANFKNNPREIQNHLLGARREACAKTHLRTGSTSGHAVCTASNDRSANSGAQLTLPSSA